ncbi:MAG: aminomethyl-transferring glycine dehydrogenase subunit GcvPB, partial [Muribaculaceae bacterium]|nr:aminomethyl-transferring glycine dehydrogenase subunit GcvPB [Muribaculaceae bacterium]
MNSQLYDKLIFEYSKPGRQGFSLPKRECLDCLDSIPQALRRQKTLNLPEVDEPTVVRHYTNQSTNNFGVDTGFYPLGSCTMKYNPKINEAVAADTTIASLHPAQPTDTVQGALELYWRLQRALCSIGGMAEFTLNPFAGAHGELTGLMVIRAYHASRDDNGRQVVIVPDSAHGTNPASAAVAGLQVRQVNSMPDGTVDLDDLRSKLDDSVAAVMLTNPNTI